MHQWQTSTGVSVIVSQICMKPNLAMLTPTLGVDNTMDKSGTRSHSVNSSTDGSTCADAYGPATPVRKRKRIYSRNRGKMGTAPNCQRRRK